MSKQPKVTKAFEKVLEQEYFVRIERLLENPERTQADTVFYHALLHLAIDFDAQKFNTQFQYTDFYVNAYCQMTTKTFLKSRNHLKELGFIDFTVVEKKVAVYTLL